MRSTRKLEQQRAILERLYREFHHPRYLQTDPLGIVHRYEHNEDREVAALIAASFAFGNFKSIASAVDNVLQPFGPQPASALRDITTHDLKKLHSGFVYRWVREEDLRLYLAWISAALREHGSLENLWMRGDSGEATILKPLAHFVDTLTCQQVKVPRRERIVIRANGRQSILPSGAHLLLTSPAGKSSCKRMNLFLRWVVRPNDGIDLGLWSISPSRLIMPVDTHVLQMSRMIGLTRRTVADLKTAEEITARLRAICPEDPTRYDFSFVRPGMMRLKEVIAEMKKELH